eukprot:gene1310-583_t
MKNTTQHNEDDGKTLAGLCLYFVTALGKNFRCTYLFRPYFYVDFMEGAPTRQMMEIMEDRFSEHGCKAEIVAKDDLQMEDHLAGKLHPMLKLNFDNMDGLMTARRDLSGVIKKNTTKFKDDEYDLDGEYTGRKDVMDFIIKSFEFDVQYLARVAIDREIRCGKWYTVEQLPPNPNNPRSEIVLEPMKGEDGQDLKQKAPMRVIAWDIETCKAPLKFPSAANAADEIMMISLMTEDNKGHLIINRSVVSEDIMDCEYIPKKEYAGYFTSHNVANEAEVLKTFFKLIRKIDPHVQVTFNGDNFDIPYVETRCERHDLNMYKEIGLKKDGGGDDCYIGKWQLHLDCLYWVIRDSYLPCGARGLKSVTQKKLKYTAEDLDPELMTPYAKEQPQVLAKYSVSDAVATYFIYTKYIHNFIFALATVIPLHGDDVLRKGSGTLCEHLLMAEAFRKNIVFPDKHREDPLQYYQGRLIETSTYEGGRVECLRTGIFRDDFPETFHIDPTAVDLLKKGARNVAEFFLKIEENVPIEDVENFDDIVRQIEDGLEALKTPIPVPGKEKAKTHMNQEGVELVTRHECPLIYHIDVGAMYPNIILSHRLQPTAIVDEDFCTACTFNNPANNCKRRMEWKGRHDLFMATKADVKSIQMELELGANQAFTTKDEYGELKKVMYKELPEHEKIKHLLDRVKKFSQKAYKRIKNSIEEMQEDIVCQRENPFYVDTVRNFRDRRYVFKRAVKTWFGNLKDAEKENDEKAKIHANDMMTLNDSLQLAHKCILNSFYGYVMRKGARWHSMKMAGIVTYTGSSLIKEARAFVDRVGLPLELDTDGIWCMLPESFPENFYLNVKGKKKELEFPYPCSVMNVRVHEKYTNHQYQTRIEGNKFETKSENSIFFEIDGPYKAMLLPASTEEGKMLKKRYAVYNLDGSIAELKGFEMKRRGELKMVQIFQEEVFPTFLKGDTVQDVYREVGAVANRWADIITNQGKDISDDELMTFLSENKSMSKSVVDSGNYKSVAITTAKRLADMLQVEDFLTEKGIACHLMIARLPTGASTTERAIPIKIFGAEKSLKERKLKEWLGDSSLKNFDMRSILDWDYYKGRLASTVLKIVSIPAARQRIPNPCPSLPFPPWMQKKVREWNDTHKQTDIRGWLKPRQNKRKPAPEIKDIEDFGKLPDELPDIEGIAPPIVEEAPRDPTQAHKDWLNKDGGRKIYQQLRREIKLARELEAKKAARIAQENKGIEADDTWHVVAMEPHEMWSDGSDEDVGVQRWWITSASSKRMEVIKVECKRHFIMQVDDLQARGSDYYQNSSRVLRMPPRNQSTNGHIVEMKFRELDYQRLTSGGQSISHSLSSGQTARCYETEIPLDFDIVVRYSSVVRLTRDHQNAAVALDHISKNTLHVDEEPIIQGDILTQDIREPYLPTGLEAVYLHIIKQDDGALFCGLWSPLLKQVTLSLVRAPGKKFLATDNFNKEMRQCLANFGLEAKCETIDESFERNAFAALSEKMVELKARQRRCIVVLSSNIPLDILRKTELPVLLHFPILESPTLPNDTKYTVGEEGFAEWMTKRWGNRFPKLVHWYSSHFGQCQVANVPIGSVPTNRTVASYAWDVVFARHLRAQKQILWATPLTRPDFGDANLTGDDALEQTHRILQSATSPPLQVNNPGFYRSICLDVQLGAGLMISAIMNALYIDADTGEGDLSMANDGKVISTGVTGHTSQVNREAFRCLVTMVKNMAETGAKRPESRESMQKLMDGLHSWLTSPSSLLYDSALLQKALVYMKRVFRLLLGEMRKHGCQIIYANPTRIIFATGKVRTMDVGPFWQSIWKNLKAKPILHSIGLDEEAACVKNVSYGYCWYNPANFSRLDVTDDGGVSNNTVSSWNMGEFLPLAVRNYFWMFIAELLKEPQHYLKKLTEGEDLVIPDCPEPDDLADKVESMNVDGKDEEQTQPEKLKPGSIPTPSTTVLSTLECLNNTSSYITDVYFPGLRTRILDFVREQNVKCQECSTSVETDPDSIFQRRAWEFAAPAGTWRSNTAPLLEFTKSLCEVLRLDHDAKDDVVKLRLDLLRVLTVGAFAKEAEFSNPCASLVLQDVSCGKCGAVGQVDIPIQFFKQPGSWVCQFCSQAYDRDMMEARLVDLMETTYMAWACQEYACNKCKESRKVCMNTVCDCSGSFEGRLKRDDVERVIHVLHGIAAAHNLQCLQQTLTRMRKMVGGSF